MLARQLAYITYVRGSMSTLQILLFLYFYGFMPPTLSREEPFFITFFTKGRNGLETQNVCMISAKTAMEAADTHSPGAGLGWDPSIIIV